MKEPDFAGMTKDEIVAWFRSAESLAPVMEAMRPSTDPAPGTPPDAPMMLVSIRVPVSLMGELDDLGRLHGIRRSEVIREALTEYVHERKRPVDRDDAEHALDVLRRVVATHREGHTDAA
jgi:predicted transcriptional regulator